MDKKSVMVIGGGGREHAICAKLKESEKVGKLYCAPGNAGTAAIATNAPFGALEFDKIASFAKENAIDIIFVAPDDPLAKGLVNRLEAEGIKAFGPREEAAIIEASKAFSKAFMKRHNIPTADYQIFSDFSAALEYAKVSKYPLVIKADGLALGKGVIIAKDFSEAEAALSDIMQKKIFGESGREVVIEEFLTGTEVTILAFTDGKSVKCMPSSQDHKKAYDGDQGPNTGGMGAFAPSPKFTEEIAEETLNNIILPTLKGLLEENRVFKGVIYFGLMLTDSGVKVVEYNARFGDPETQVVLPLLKTDLLDIVEAVIEGRLDELEIEWEERTGFTVVCACAGYPASSQKGLPIEIGELGSDIILYHAGTKLQDGKPVTNGGRVFSVTTVKENIESARKTVYAEIDKIKFSGMRYRKDIGIK